MSELQPTSSVADTRDRLTRAALDAFAELGFHGATVRDIAKRADVSIGLIAHHFDDKDGLWNFVGHRVTEDYVAFMTPVLSVESVDGETIPKVLEAYMSYWLAHPVALRLQVWRASGAPMAERRARVERLNRLTVPLFERAQKAGFVRDDIPAGQAMTTATSLIQYRLHSRLEMDDAIGVTGHVSPSDAEILRYAWSLIAGQPERRAKG